MSKNEKSGSLTERALGEVIEQPMIEIGFVQPKTASRSGGKCQVVNLHGQTCAGYFPSRIQGVNVTAVSKPSGDIKRLTV